MERLNLQFYANCIIFLHDRETFLFWDFFSKNGKSYRLKRNQGVAFEKLRLKSETLDRNIETRSLLNFTLAKLHYLCMHVYAFWLIQSCNPAEIPKRGTVVTYEQIESLMARLDLRSNADTTKDPLRHRGLHYTEDSSGLISFSRNAS